MTAPARMTAAPRHPFEVREAPRHEHPMIVGTIARVSDAATGAARTLAGQPVVITDARRCRPDGPLWLTLAGLAVRGPLAGRNAQVHMTVDAAHQGGLTDYLPGEWRAATCGQIDHDGCAWHVTHNPMVGPSTFHGWIASANDAAQLAHDLYTDRIATARRNTNQSGA